MHIFFSGIGGTGIGPLALVAKQAGYEVSGSDKQSSLYIDYLRNHSISNITIGQTTENIAAAHARLPIDWYVYSSAVAIEQPDAPEFQFCRKNNIRVSKRDELLNTILSQKNLKLIAVAGTHGKTTTTAMTIWALKQLGVPIGYILPAKSSFAEMGAYEAHAEYFVYECDEFDRNFLHYSPTLSLVTGVAWDHPDIYPSQADYDQAFRDFCQQSATNVLWQSDVDRLGLKRDAKTIVLSDTDQKMGQIKLAGAVNRRNAWQVAMALATLPLTSTAQPAVNLDMLVSILKQFPGVSRRFEQIVPGLYSDYAHTPEKVLGALQLGHEVAGKNLVVVYEGLHNTRQHFIRKQLVNLFSGVKQLYVVPSYRARENTLLEDLTPKKLIASMNPTVQAYAAPAELGTDLRERLQTHLAGGDTVLCLTAGGGGSLDEWLRQQF